MWDARLGELGLALREVGGHSVRLRDTSFMVHAWIVEQSPPAGIVFGPLLTTIENRSRDGSPSGALPAVIAPRARVTHPTVSIPPSPSGTWARLRIATPGGISWCRVVLDDESLHTLATAPCVSGTRYVQLPARTRGISITLENTSNRTAPLPTQIDLALAM